MIDVRTLIFTLSLGFFLVAAMAAYMSRLHREEPAIGFWSAGSLAIGMGALLLFLRPMLPLFVAIVVANVLTIAGAYLLYAGIATFDRRPTFLKTSMTASVVVGALLAYWTYVTPDYFYRVALVTGTLLPMAMLTAVALLHPGGREHVAMRRVLGVMFCYLTLLSVYRIGDALLGYHPDRGNLFVNSTLQAIWFLSMLLVTFMACFDFLLMPGQRMQRRLQELARIDDLTGLLNRRAFNDRMQQEAGAAPGVTSVLVLDLDHFKQLNDHHGHAAGDAVLRQFSATVTAQLRHGDVCARYGGEEFSVLLPGIGAEAALAAAERIRSAVQHMEVRFRDVVLKTTVSIGIAPMDGEDVEACLALADSALYQAKRLGRNRVEISASTHEPRAPA